MKCLCCVRPRTYHCKVVLLDEQELLQEIQDTTLGQEILDTVFRHLNLLETSYFGLRFIDASNQTHWLDTTKRIVKQLKGKDSLTLYFGVKFYAVDPCKLLEEITRYQFFLQVKQDILQGRLPVTFELNAELGAYVVQSELGDYEPRRHSPGYVSEFRFTSHQSAALESKVADNHRELSGQTPSEAELNYLDRVKSLPLYGVDLHPVLGEDSIEYFLGLTPAGIVVLRNKVKVASYLWPKITKIYSKGKYFMIRVCDKTDEENTYGFETPSRPACKHLYKCCVDHHTFFRLVQVAPNPPPDIISSRFSSGRGEKFSSVGGGRSSQLIRNPPSFTRTPSKRYTRRSEGGDGESIAPNEDRGVGNGAVEGSVYGEMKNVSVPQPVSSMGYHPTRSDSPRSTRSAPWHLAAPRAGLFSQQSPRSVRSAATVAGVHHSSRGTSGRRKPRSSSLESRSSNESKPCRRRRRSSRGKRGSDNESEHSRCSSRHRRRHRQRDGDKGHDRGSRKDSAGGSERGGSRGQERGSRIKTSSSEKQIYELVDSESQWKQVQLRRASIQQAAIVRPKSGYMNSGLETESEYSYQQHQRRKHRKHSSRSRSPSEASGGSKLSARLAPEVARALEFSLVDTEGMSPAQLRSIPYTEIKTSSRVKLSPSGHRKHHHHHSRHSGRSKSTDKDSASDTATTQGNSLPPNPMGGADSPPPPYSESSNSSLNKVGDGGAGAPQPQTVPGTQQRSSGRSSHRHPSSALYSHPATLLGNPSSSTSNSVPWLDRQTPQGYSSMSRRSSDHTISSGATSSARSSLRVPHSNSAQQFPTHISSRSGHSNSNANYRWQNSEIRGVGLSQYTPLGNANPKPHLYPTPPTSGSQSDLLDSLSSMPSQRHPVFNRSESISSDNLLESSCRMRDSSQRTSSFSSDNLLNSTYVDEESRQCNELIDFASDRLQPSDAVYRNSADQRKSNRNSQDFDRLSHGEYRSQIVHSDSRNNNQLCDSDNLALENRLQNIHLNQNLIDARYGEKLESGRIVDNRLGTIDNRMSNSQLSNSVKVESGVLKRYTNTPSGGVIPWPGVFQGSINSAAYQGNQTGSGSNVNNMYGVGNNVHAMRHHQQSSQPSSETDNQRPPASGALNNGPTSSSQYNIMTAGPNVATTSFGATGPGLGFQMEPDQSSGVGTNLMRQEMMNTLSDASTTWDGLPITQYTQIANPNAANNKNKNPLPTSVANMHSNIVANINSGWDDSSHLSNTNISGIAPLSRSSLRGSMNQGPLFYSTHGSNQEIVITPTQLAAMLTPISTHPPSTFATHPAPLDHQRSLASSNMPSSNHQMTSSTLLANPRPGSKLASSTPNSSSANAISPSLSRLVTSTPKGSPAETTFPFCNQSAIGEDLESVPEECEESARHCEVVSGNFGPSDHSQGQSQAEASLKKDHSQEKLSHVENSNAKENESPKSDEEKSKRSINNRVADGSRNVNSKKSSPHGSDSKSMLSHDRSRNTKTNTSSKISSQNLPGIHRSSVGKSTRESLAEKKDTLTAQNPQNVPNSSESTDFQSTNCNVSSTAFETMESGASIEENSSLSPAKLPNNINERAQQDQLEQSNSHCRQESMSVEFHGSFVTSDRNTSDTSRVCARKNGLNHTDLNRNDISNIPVIEKSNIGHLINRNTNIDGSMFLDNRTGTDWSKFDYSGSISNNNIDETSGAVSTLASQTRGLGSNTGSGGNQLMSKNHLYHEMCTEL